MLHQGTCEYDHPKPFEAAASDAGSLKLSSGRKLSSCLCQVDGCGRNLSKDKEYYRRYRVCKTHAAAGQVFLDGEVKRYCQQCSVFHELASFDDNKRSCRDRLLWHNDKRRKRLSKAATAAATVAVSEPLRMTRRVAAASAAAAISDAPKAATDSAADASTAAAQQPVGPEQASAAASLLVAQGSDPLRHNSVVTSTPSLQAVAKAGHLVGLQQSAAESRYCRPGGAPQQSVSGNIPMASHLSSTAFERHGSLGTDSRPFSGSAAASTASGCNSTLQHCLQQQRVSFTDRMAVGGQSASGMCPLQQPAIGAHCQQLNPASMQQHMLALLLQQQQQQQQQHARDFYMAHAAAAAAAAALARASGLPAPDFGALLSQQQAMAASSCMSVKAPSAAAAASSHCPTLTADQLQWMLAASHRAASGSNLLPCDQTVQAPFTSGLASVQQQGLLDHLQWQRKHSELELDKGVAPYATPEFSGPDHPVGSLPAESRPRRTEVSVPASPGSHLSACTDIAFLPSVTQPAMTRQPPLADFLSLQQQQQQQQQQRLHTLAASASDLLGIPDRTRPVVRPVHDPRAATSLVNVARAAFTAEAAAVLPPEPREEPESSETTAARSSAFRLYKPVAKRGPYPEFSSSGPIDNDNGKPCDSLEYPQDTAESNGDRSSTICWKQRVLQKVNNGCQQRKP